jgi:catechol 2,3-dioxygenase-like lactoylglutathione lyase family enzyme
MARGIDHLVCAVRDLDAARRSFGRLGFTLTPPARHPFGTANSLVQFDGGFLELLAIAEPAAIPEATPTRFSFGAFNRAFLARREGPSMLALRSADAGADRAAFAAEGLPLYDPLSFERVARGPDGTDRPVAFDLTFTRDDGMTEAGFFTCRNRYPENFWQPAFQAHPNGAIRIHSVLMAAPDPADHHEFLSKFIGQREIRSTSLGIELDTGAGRVAVLSPPALLAWFGEAGGGARPARLVGCRIVVADLAAARRLLSRHGVGYEERMQQIVIPPAETNGTVLALVDGTFGT